jgi:3D (Asp-Asp-Asp) domain-containing protein
VAAPVLIQWVLEVVDPGKAAEKVLAEDRSIRESLTATDAAYKATARTAQVTAAEQAAAARSAADAVRASQIRQQAVTPARALPGVTGVVPTATGVTTRGLIGEEEDIELQAANKREARRKDEAQKRSAYTSDAALGSSAVADAVAREGAATEANTASTERATAVNERMTATLLQNATAASASSRATENLTRARTSLTKITPITPFSASIPEAAPTFGHAPVHPQITPGARVLSPGGFATVESVAGQQALLMTDAGKREAYTLRQLAVEQTEAGEAIRRTTSSTRDAIPATNDLTQAHHESGSAAARTAGHESTLARARHATAAASKSAAKETRSLIGEMAGGLATIAKWGAFGAAGLVGAAGIATVTGLRRAGEVGQQAAGLAGISGLSPKAATGLAIASESAGIQARSLGQSFSTLGKQVLAYEKGTKTSVAAFEALKISPQQVSSMRSNLPALIDLVYQQGQKLPGAERAAYERQLLGRGAITVPQLEAAAGPLQRIVKGAPEIDPKKLLELRRASVELDDAMTKLELQFAETFGPSLIELLEAITPAIKPIGDVIREGVGAALKEVKALWPEVKEGAESFWEAVTGEETPHLGKAAPPSRFPSGQPVARPTSVGLTGPFPMPRGGQVNIGPRPGGIAGEPAKPFSAGPGPGAALPTSEASKFSTILKSVGGELRKFAIAAYEAGEAIVKGLRPAAPALKLVGESARVSFQLAAPILTLTAKAIGLLGGAINSLGAPGRLLSTIFGIGLTGALLKSGEGVKGLGIVFTALRLPLVLAGGAVTLFGKALTGIAPALEILPGKLGTIARTLTSWAGTATQAFGSLLAGNLKKAAEKAGGDAEGGLRSKLASGIGKVKSVASSLVSSAIEGLSPLAGRAASAGAAAGKAVGDGIRGATRYISGAISGLINVATSTIAGLAQAIAVKIGTSDWGSAWKAMFKQGTYVGAAFQVGAVAGVIGLAAALLNKIMEEVGRLHIGFDPTKILKGENPLDVKLEPQSSARGAVEGKTGAPGLTKRRGGFVGQEGGFVPSLVSPGEQIVYGGMVATVPGARNAADSVATLLPAGAAVLTDSGQALMAGGASLVQAVASQAPHFASGGFVATAYGPPWGGIQGGGRTATGIDLSGSPHLFIIAVDPSVIPLHSKVGVRPNPFNTSNLFGAEDTGGAIKGHRIDFYDWRGRAAQNAWGRRQVEVSSSQLPVSATGGRIPHADEMKATEAQILAIARKLHLPGIGTTPTQKESAGGTAAYKIPIQLGADPHRQGLVQDAVAKGIEAGQAGLTRHEIDAYVRGARGARPNPILAAVSEGIGELTKEVTVPTPGSAEAIVRAHTGRRATPGTTSNYFGGFLRPGTSASMQRHDQGRDIQLNVPGQPIIAPGGGKVTGIHNDPAGFGPDYPVVKFTSGAYKGREVYIGHTDTALQSGARFSTGDILAYTSRTGHNAKPGWAEIGYWNGGPEHWGGAVPFRRGGFTGQRGGIVGTSPVGTALMGLKAITGTGTGAIINAAVGAFDATFGALTVHGLEVVRAQLTTAVHRAGPAAAVKALQGAISAIDFELGRRIGEWELQAERIGKGAERGQAQFERNLRKAGIEASSVRGLELTGTADDRMIASRKAMVGQLEKALALARKTGVVEKVTEATDKLREAQDALDEALTKRIEDARTLVRTAAQESADHSAALMTLAQHGVFVAELPFRLAGREAQESPAAKEAKSAALTATTNLELRHQEALEYRRGVLQNTGASVAEIDSVTGEITTAVEGYFSTVAEATSLIREAAEQSAAEAVEVAKSGTSTAQTGLERFELEQKLAETYGTGAAARAEYITQKVIPALENEIAYLRNQQAVAEGQGNVKLARQIAEEIGKVQNGILQDQLTVMEDVKDNTQPKFGGTLGFTYGGETLTDALVAVGSGA